MYVCVVGQFFELQLKKNNCQCFLFLYDKKFLILFVFFFGVVFERKVSFSFFYDWVIFVFSLDNEKVLFVVLGLGSSFFCNVLQEWFYIV